jgi:ABC-type sugar transport system ATPase subunit
MQLEALSLGKRYGNTIALDNVSISLQAGQIYALAGENGAGKSTLLKILAGSERHDTGEMRLDGVPFRPRDLREAEERGVGLVFQELTINPSLGIAENIYIDRLRDFANRLGWIDQKRLNASAQRMLDEIGAEISVRQALHELDLGQWKCLEICRALSNKPSVLFFDESTAYLGLKEVQAVLGVMRRLRKQGLTIAFVSHHLDEITDIADRVVILKDGQLVGAFPAEEMPADRIHALMVGRSASGSIYPAKRPETSTRPILEIDGLCLAGGAATTSLVLHKGEILGVAGLKGSGGEELLAVLSGDVPRPGATIRMDGEPYVAAAPAEAWAAGVAHLPGDRGSEGLILDFPMQDNLVMADIPHFGPFLRLGEARVVAERIVAALGIRPPKAELPCRSLSGGNMQKVVLGKCLVPGPKILLLNNPTRGVDVGAREEIYRVVRALVAAGTSVILLSEDLPELLGMSDRLIVMRRGAITKTFEPGCDWSEEDVIKQMV